MSGRVPQLLVSVRDVSEVLAALLGGADIVDVKEPGNGSLGRASAETIADIAASIDRNPANRHLAVPLSLALGEVTEWLGKGTAEITGDTASVIGRLRPRFLKLGLSGLCGPAAVDGDWFQTWIQVRNLFPGEHSWVAVAYADAERAFSPSLGDVCQGAVKSGCGVLLIDTFEKDGSTLLDWLTREQLQELRAFTTAHRIQFALAGRISTPQLPLLAEFQPDIIAVRGAVCAAGLRTSTISEQRVRQFRQALGDCRNNVDSL